MILTYYRYYALGEEKIDDLQEALITAYNMIEFNTACPHELLNDDRTVLFDHEEFRNKLSNWESPWDIELKKNDA